MHICPDEIAAFMNLITNDFCAACRYVKFRALTWIKRGKHA